MRNDFESNYLMHHGILGMKWGSRNGPPYPLGSEDHSASEKKAGYKKSIGGGRNEELYDRKKKKNKSIADKVSSKVHEINGKRLESAAKAKKRRKTMHNNNRSLKHIKKEEEKHEK